jgi:hypothetical protein
MAHFAKVRDGKVVEVLVMEPEFLETFVDETPGEWIQCSYNTRGGVHYDPETREPSADQTKALRKNYPSIGFTYDPVRDAFFSQQPYNSWTLNEDTCMWEPPVPYPTDADTVLYAWNDQDQIWKAMTE